MKLNPDAKLSVLAFALTSLFVPGATAGKPGGATPGGTTVGVVTIDQTKAANGGVTDGDAPGFPVTLSQPGSYRLESNLTVADTTTSVIVITADDVTLDLNGFAIIGPNVCTSPGVCNFQSSARGIDSSTVNTAVFGGTVRGMGSAGIALGRNARVERVHARFNGGAGISVGLDSLVADCAAELNATFGIAAGYGSLILCNIVAYNHTGLSIDENNPPNGNASIGANVFMFNTLQPFNDTPIYVLPNSCFGNACF